MKRALLLAVLVVPAAACASAHAKAPAAPVTMDVPPVPPRAIAPLPPAEPPDIEPVQPLPEQEPPPAPRPRPQPRPSTSQTPQPPEVKQEPPAEPPAQAQPPASASVPPLRAPGTGDGPEAERQVGAIIGRAEHLLQNIDYRYLSDERKVLYDSAKNYITQSQEALKASNIVLARSLAERAENTAKQLSGK